MKSKLFYQWLAGQLDGDGCFHVTPLGVCIVTVTTHTLDEDMIDNMHYILGIGHLYYKPNQNCYVYSLQQKSHVIDLLHNVNG